MHLLKAVRLFSVISFGLLVSFATSAATLTINEAAKLIASDAEVGDQSGRSVSIDEDTAVIGVPGDDDNGDGSGAAYIFTRNAGIWTQQQKLTASDAEAGDSFGRSVEVSGNSIVIGAIGDDENGDSSGSAYVFTRDKAGVWTQQQKLIASDGSGEDVFGAAIAMDEDTLVIGAPGDYGPGPYDYNTGAAYVFIYEDGIWTEETKLNASDGGAYDSFGLSLAVVGETILTGAGQDGAAHVFTRNQEGLWVEAIITASDGDFLGQYIAMDEDTAVIGAPSDSENGFFTGSAYVFVRDGAGDWIEQQEIFASDGESYDNFGWSVTVSGDTLVVGSPGDDYETGSAYLFTRNDGIWTEQKKYIASDGLTGDSLGWVVELSGTRLVAGTPFQDSNTGAAYVFDTDCESDFCITDATWTYKNLKTGFGFLTISGFSPYRNESITIIDPVTGDEVFKIRSKPDGTFTTTQRRGMFDDEVPCIVQAVVGVDVSNFLAVANAPESCVSTPCASTAR